MSQPECEYCGEPGDTRFEGFSVCTDCDYRLRLTDHVDKRRARQDELSHDDWMVRLE